MKCAEYSISLQSPPEPIIQEGWSGKANGMYQVLQGRGFLNERDKAKYIVNETKTHLE